MHMETKTRIDSFKMKESAHIFRLLLCDESNQNVPQTYKTIFLMDLVQAPPSPVVIALLQSQTYVSRTYLTNGTPT